MSDDEVPYCGHLALPKFRKQAEGMMTSCVCGPEHRGNHVYAVRVAAGINRRSHAIHYLEEIKRTELKPVMNVDMGGNWRESNVETCAAIWQYFEAAKEARKSINE